MLNSKANEKIFRRTTKLKMLASVLLLFSIFLPFSSCTRQYSKSESMNANLSDNSQEVYKVPVPDEKTSNVVDGEYVTLVKTTNYIIKDFNFDEYDDWLMVLCFVWPILLLCFSRLSRGKKRHFFTWGLQPMLAVLSGYLIVCACVLSSPESGAYFSFILNASILVLWLFEAGFLIYLKRKYRNFSIACTQAEITLPLCTGW